MTRDIPPDMRRRGVLLVLIQYMGQRATPERLNQLMEVVPEEADVELKRHGYAVGRGAGYSGEGLPQCTSQPGPLRRSTSLPLVTVLLFRKVLPVRLSFPLVPLFIQPLRQLLPCQRHFSV